MAEIRASLLEGDIKRQLRDLSVPVVWGLISINVFYIADTWFIGRLGTEYLAAFGFISPMIMLFMGVIFGLMVGATSVLSRIYGAGDMEKLRQTCADIWLLTLICVTAASVLGLATIDSLFRRMGAPESLLPMIDEFMVVWYCGLPFLSLTMVGYSFLRAAGDTKFQSSMQITATAIMLALDPVLIYGWFGFPRLELTGAALALVVSNVICFFITIYRIVIRRRMVARLSFHAGIVESWKKLLHIAVPNIFSNLIAPVSLAIVTRMTAAFGQAAVAALGVASRIENTVVMMFFALAGGMAIFSGQNYGAGNYGRIQQAARIGAGYALVIGFASAAILYLVAEPLAAVFDSNPDVIAHTAQYLRVVPVSYAAFGVMLICSSIFNAAGKPVPPTVLVVLKMVVLYVPLAYILQGYFGFTGIVVALSVTNVVTGVIAYLWNRKAIS